MRRDKKLMLYGKARRALEVCGGPFLCNIADRTIGMHYQGDGLSITSTPIDGKPFIDYDLTVELYGKKLLEGREHGKLVARRAGVLAYNLLTEKLDSLIRNDEELDQGDEALL